MVGFFLSVAVFIAWVVIWAVLAGLLTAAALVGAGLMEKYLLVSDRWTFPLWVVALSISPGGAFWLSTVLWGVVLSPEHFRSVRYGTVAAGLVFAVIAVTVVSRAAEGEAQEEEDGGEMGTLIGCLLVDGACCALMIWRFASVAAYMERIGGG